jgi:predicted DNA-binding transcriptional regulator AlpA
MAREGKQSLVGLAEVAELLETSLTQAGRWTARPDFPEPVAHLRATRVWRRSDVERWARKAELQRRK